jgi:ABC-2 type transport system permease protein
MRGVWKLILVEAKLLLREPIVVFFSLIFPLMSLFLFGAIYGNDPKEIFQGRGTVDISVPAFSALTIATIGVGTIPSRIATYREKGILRRLCATPVRPLAILAAQVVVYFAMTLLELILLLIAGRLVYQIRFDGNLVSVFLGFTLTAHSFFAFGFVIASLARTAREAQVISTVAFYPMIFLSGATIPIELLPEGIRRYVSLLPLAHAVALLRGLWFGGTLIAHTKEVTILLGMLILGVIVSTKTFRWE